ncbi:uncharacterized protein PV09_02162 [Verruconis gallopava]|uniref:Uncharacterized protein n=1 Tax=Verruconis gallopava TaxID=253628 RepID=A0A0D1Z2Y5_9PEZI|nr:uncharacterized protein PV09_02162 [Verruconis gallopava]KIW07312.1 hypothetical protein PV09_02162 [Verruconis gallopava]
MSLSQVGSFPTKKLHTLSDHNGQVHALTYSSGSSQYLLTGSTDRTIRLFNPAKGTLIQKYVGGHGYEVLDISVAQDNTTFASVGGDKLVFLWDVATARTVRRWEGHSGRINAVSFAGEGDSVVVSGSYDATVKLWDGKSQSYKPIMSLGEAKDSISSVLVSRWEVSAGCVDGRVRTYDIRMGKCIVDVVGHSVTSLAGTKDGATVLVSTLDSMIRLFDRRDGKLLQSFKDEGFRNEDYRIRAALGMNDSIVISGSEDGSIYVWDLVEAKLLHKLSHVTMGITASGSKKRDVVSAVAYCPSGRKEWCSAGGNGVVVVWGTGEHD